MTINTKLMSLGLSVALVTMVGVGVAAAQTTATDETTPIVSVARDRDHVRDCDLDGTEPLQVRDRLHDATRDGDTDRVAETERIMTNDGTCLLEDRPLDGTGLHLGHRW